MLNISLPPFNHISTQEIQPALEKILKQNLAELENCDNENPIYLLEKLENRLQKFWSPIAHLHAVKSTPELRKVYSACLPLLSDYEATLSHHQKLYQAFREFKPKNHTEKRITFLKLRDFHLSGADLPPEKKSRYAQIEKELSQLETHFGENVLDATQSFEYHPTSEEITGIPEHLLPEKNLFTLDYPCYSAVQKYADNRNLREKFYKAYVTRASEFDHSKYDNTKNMFQILLLRNELAQLLEFKQFAELSLATKMVKKTEEVLTFLNNLVNIAKPKAMLELKELNDFAGFELAPWDMAFYSEKLSQKKFHIQQELFRPYFKIPSVLKGLFDVVHKIYQIKIVKLDFYPNHNNHSIEIWNDLVECYGIYDKNESCIGIFYLDLYARKLKREGAWMDDYCSRYTHENNSQIPVAYLTCNFLPPNNTSLHESSGMTHDDVITLFHEFGHGLHHLLTKIDRIDIAGIHGVPWDAVEIPSQFMENFCWQKEVLKLISDNTLPEDLITRLISSRHFQAALQLIRQLEFGLFDFHVHLIKPHHEADVMEIFHKVHRETAVIPTPDYVRFPHTFSHIFAGGYAAAYYSYLWAEVLSCDAFGLFEETGIFNSETGSHFLNAFLSQGGSEEPEILFEQFRHRPPNQTAFLKSWGLLDP